MSTAGGSTASPAADASAPPARALRLATGILAPVCVLAAGAVALVGARTDVAVVGTLLALVAGGLVGRAAFGAGIFLAPGLVLGAAPAALGLVDRAGTGWGLAACGPLLLAAGELVAVRRAAMSLAPPVGAAARARLAEVVVLVGLGAGVAVGAIAVARVHVRPSALLMGVGVAATVGALWLSTDVRHLEGSARHPSTARRGRPPARRR
jgi:hypothetical protein